MANGSSGALIGWSVTGFGAILLYATFKNRKLFGQSGLITEAIQLGQLPNLKDVPAAYKQVDLATGKVTDNTQSVFPLNSSESGGYQIVGNSGNPVAEKFFNAVVTVSTRNYNLAVQIVKDFYSFQFEGRTAAAKQRILNDIAVVRGLGLNDEANAVQAMLVERGG